LPNVNVNIIYQFILKNVINTHDVVTVKKSKGHLYNIQIIKTVFEKSHNIILSIGIQFTTIIMMWVEEKLKIVLWNA
jgi:hypothetical protein